MKDRDSLRYLADKVAYYASLPVMAERKRLWKCSNDLKAERPMVLVETVAVEGFKAEDELVCEDPYLRDVEKALRETIKHYEMLNDDFIIEPYYRIPWKIKISDYGVSFGERHAADTTGRDLAYTFDYPIKNPEDLDKLHKRHYQVFREDTIGLSDKVNSVIGDILPVRLGGLDLIFTEWDGIFSLVKDAVDKYGNRRYLGYTPFTGGYFIGLPMDMYKLLGNENLMLWPYDHPDALKALGNFLMEDRLSFFKWLEKESLLDINSDNQLIGSAPYGYVSELPGYSQKPASTKLKDMWCWAEAQEAQLYGPQMFEEFVLPYVAKICELFGLVFYGCCERLDEKFDSVKRAIPNIRSVAVSPWSNPYKMAEQIGKDYVFCKKPMPSYISGPSVNWCGLEKELKDTLEAAKGCNLQFVVRDVYDVNGDIQRLRKWTDLAKKLIDAVPC